MNLKETSEFTISVTGDRTGEKWFGTFKALRRTSHRDDLRKDRIRRELLGQDAQFASERSLSQAEVFSTISISIVDAPGWWKEAGGGLDLADDNVIAAVYENVIKIQSDAIDEINKKGEQAELELKDLAKKE